MDKKTFETLANAGALASVMIEMRDSAWLIEAWIRAEESEYVRTTNKGLIRFFSSLDTAERFVREAGYRHPIMVTLGDGEDF